jgi:hypothetical protein
MQDEERLVDTNVGIRSLRHGCYHIEITLQQPVDFHLLLRMFELTKERQ